MLHTLIDGLHQEIKRRLVVEESVTREQVYLDLQRFGLESRSYRHAKELWRALMLDIFNAIAPFSSQINQRTNQSSGARVAPIDRDYSDQQQTRSIHPRPSRIRDASVTTGTRISHRRDEIPEQKQELNNFMREAVPILLQSIDFNALLQTANHVPPPTATTSTTIIRDGTTIEDVAVDDILEEAIREMNVNR